MGLSDSIGLPLAPGRVIVFDHIAGKVYEADALGVWRPPRSEQTHNRRSLRGPLARLRQLMRWGLSDDSGAGRKTCG